MYERDGHRCVRCGLTVQAGNRNVHHRRPRASGGQANPHALSNLITLHGSGTTGCHGETEQRRPETYERGFLVRPWENPLEVPVLRYDGKWCLYGDDGTVTFPEWAA